MRSIKTIYPNQVSSAVKKITIITEDDTNDQLHAMRFFADGLPRIMFHQSSHDTFINKENKKLSSLFFFGQTIKPIEISTVAPFKIIFFHLYSHVTNALFGIDAHELTNTCINYDLLIGNRAYDLVNRLQDLYCTQTQINLIHQSLQRLLFEIKSASSCDLHLAIESINNTIGEIPLVSIQQKLRVTERTFERKFLQHVGVTPRLFKRICKFSTSLRDLERGSFSKLTDVAYNNGFADQSHFNRTFKEFTGFTPGEYVKIVQTVSVHNIVEDVTPHSCFKTSGRKASS